MILVTAAEMRRLDALTIERYGTPGHVLMERAGAGAADVLLAQFPHVRRRRVVVVAGKGNNGGDGFVIARLLRKKGVRAEVVLLGKRNDVKGDAARMLAALRLSKSSYFFFEAVICNCLSTGIRPCKPSSLVPPRETQPPLSFFSLAFLRHFGCLRFWQSG